MSFLSQKTIDTINWDLDKREEVIRQAVTDGLSQMPPVDVSESIVASYFVVARTLKLEDVGREISYHMTSGIRNPSEGSLLYQCTGQVQDAKAFDSSGKIGLVRVTFPLKMFLDRAGKLYSTDILHVTAGAGVFALTEYADIKLVDLAFSDDALNLFPGPAHGVSGIRKLTNIEDGDIAFGTIIKPCTGITPEEEAKIIAEAAANPLFIFIKEDENFLPGVDFAPLKARLKTALEAISRVSEMRCTKGLIYAPHITSPPHIFMENLKQAIDAGVNGIMFSEYYTGGAVRAAREFTGSMAKPPVIYGHNGGITARTRNVYRDVLDMLARLDGIDFRQTSLATRESSLLRPSGQEWRRCEEVLSRPLADHKPVMIARAGGLDQGNLIPNLMDVQKGYGTDNYLFLAGSAINGIKDKKGQYEPKLGAEAMQQAQEVFQKHLFSSMEEYDAEELKIIARDNKLKSLSAALEQRYP